MAKRGPKPKNPGAPPKKAASTGRPPKSTAVRKFEGNAGNRPYNEREPVCLDPPRMPVQVSEDKTAAKEWKRVINAMPPGVYTALDEATLTLYAVSWSIMLQCQEDLRENGINWVLKAYNTDTNEYEILEIKTNPALKSWQIAAEKLRQTVVLLGLAPGARARLEVPIGNGPQKRQPQSKFAGLIGLTQD